MTTQPTLYLPHGAGPCFFMDWTMSAPDTWDRMARWLRELPATLPEAPRALLVVSAHWEENEPTVSSSPAPELLFDYSGFPPHTYELTWPAPGAPELAERVRELLGSHGLPTRANDARGLDHGVFVPLKLAFPDARVPTLQVSLMSHLGAEAHLAMGRALAPLRDEGVLILGSGMSYHNLQGIMRPPSKAQSEIFDDWLAETVAAPAAERAERLAHWDGAPEARACHPREEHLLPLHVCAGAAGADAGERIYRDEVLGVVVSAHRFA